MWAQAWADSRRRSSTAVDALNAFDITFDGRLSAARQ